MLDKAIKGGREHRNPYRGAKAVDKECRNHGTCEWCRENRLKGNKVKEMKMLDELKEYRRP